MGEADAIGKHQVVADGAGLARLRVEAQQAAVGAALQQIETPVLDIEAPGRIGEIDRSVRGDIKIVGHPDRRVVLDADEAALGLIGQQFDFAVQSHAHQAHAGDAGDDALFRVKREPERPPADVGENADFLVIRRRKPHDVSVARAAIEVVVGVERDVLRAVDLARADQLGARQLGRDVARHQTVHALHGVRLEDDRIEIRRRQQAVPVLAEFHVDRRGSR